ncbi:hypothetical protein MBRA_05088 [Methylobacterium brachiatum]|nr:hypothetical protein MBRA_05088 [Methylobacterium brachiatum]
MIAAIAFMACAALRAQTAYLHRLNGPLVAEPYTNSAIRLGLVGVACFVFAKVLT